MQHDYVQEVKGLLLWSLDGDLVMDQLPACLTVANRFTSLNLFKERVLRHLLDYIKPGSQETAALQNVLGGKSQCSNKPHCQQTPTSVRCMQHGTKPEINCCYMFKQLMPQPRVTEGIRSMTKQPHLELGKVGGVCV